ncbi:MAG: MFS transporter [Acutalibacteraceae bacterium]|nr:MFS transporter [Acutalibacteraceae bacterium]
MVNKAKSILSDARVYWNLPMPGRYMTFKEIAAYAGGGIGAYFIIYMGGQLAVNINNMIVGGAIGVSPTHMYILYIIATLANIPLTAIRANMIDNTRSKAGKYRPYLLSMGIPTVLIAMAYVWFPYKSLYSLLPMKLFGFDGGYVAMCAVVLVFNLLLQFFFNFFQDAYTNLIHVLSPNTQERTDVLAIKSVVYSLAPSIANIVLPIVSQYLTNNNMYDIKLYRVTYPIFSVIGIGLTIVVFANTKEKIVQAKTRVIQVRFVDAFKAVAKNKYFWIIALAGWLGFLESSYSNIMSWTFNYGHACNGTTMGIINTIIGNASMWGMILAPFCIRKFGKKNVLVGINTMNIICILAMGLNKTNIIWLAICVYFNWLFGAFEQITTPAIQADIRDYHQYKTGERVDGMFATVQTIGNVVTLVTSSVLPFVYESFGIYEGNGYENSFAILDVETGEAGLLEKVIGTLIIMAAVGALMNMLPYLFYDLKEKDQKGVIRILRIRAMFEDYGNGVVNDKTLVEAIDIIREARENAEKTPVQVTKADKKADKKAYKEALNLNEEIEISKMVCAELEKFNKGTYISKYNACLKVYNAGLIGLYNEDITSIAAELKEARAMPKGTKEEKELRTFAIEIAQSKLSSKKAIRKYYKDSASFKEPDYKALEALYNIEDECEAKLNALYLEQAECKKNKDSFRLKEITAEIKEAKAKKSKAQDDAKKEMDKHVQFNRAAKAYIDAAKTVKEKENYTHLEELAEQYEAAKAREEAAREAQIAEQKRLEMEKIALKEEKLAEKAAAKMAKKK